MLKKAEKLETEARKIRGAALSGVESLSEHQAAGVYKIGESTLAEYARATGKALPTASHTPKASYEPTEQDKQIAETKKAIEANARASAIIQACTSYGANGLEAASYIESNLSPLEVTERLKTKAATKEALKAARELSASLNK